MSKTLAELRAKAYAAAAPKPPQNVNPNLSGSKQLMDFLADNDRIGYLKGRWLDERQYEDFADYRVEITKVLEAQGYKVHSITEGFAITVSKDGSKFLANYGARSVRVRQFKVSA